MVNFVTATAHHSFFLALPAAFTQPGDQLSGEPCNAESTTKRERELLNGGNGATTREMLKCWKMGGLTPPGGNFLYSKRGTVVTG